MIQFLGFVGLLAIVAWMVFSKIQGNKLNPMWFGGILLCILTMSLVIVPAEKWDGAYVPTNNYGPIPVQTGSIKP